MASDRLNWFFTIAANIGVILGLGFLILEIRQSTLATQATLNLNLVTYGRENAELLASSDELADIVFRGEQDPTSLSPLELERFLIFTTWRMTAWETAFLNYDTGVVADRYWISFNTWYSRLVKSKPGYLYWWLASRHGFDLYFREHVDQVLGLESDSTTRRQQ
ncbi:hypothetical protein ACL7TT_05435 [Microbulbifer sp. 2304DJ12-6]|uniref:hypothetical protein n=1 Tax=Microbulbifer sp. 2304DJ12-6 TaxID=3233340 RepID=UPI00262D52B9|nr:hypothetical protein [uncultured Microbulbifer sp.]